MSGRAACFVVALPFLLLSIDVLIDCRKFTLDPLLDDDCYMLSEALLAFGNRLGCVTVSNLLLAVGVDCMGDRIEGVATGVL